MALTAFAKENHLAAAVLNAADLALEELLTNVWSYGYAVPGPHQVQIRLSIVDNHFEIEVKDNGCPFNPLQMPEVDTTIPLDRKPIGGLGIHLMRRFMDELHYQRQGDKNVLRMRKRLDTPPVRG